MSMTDTIQTTEPAVAHRRGGGRIGRKALRGAPVASFPTLVRKIPVYEIVPDEAVELIHEESLKHPRRGRLRVPRRRSDRHVEGSRRRRYRHPGAHRPRPADGARFEGAAGIHPERAQPRRHGAGRRQELDLRADVWRALRARPRQQAALRHAGRPQQLPQARLHVAGAAFLELDHLRADGDSGAASGISTSSIRR